MKAALNEPHFGKVLNQWRRDANLTLADVETATERALATPYMSQLERGKLPSARLDTIFRLAQLYGVETWKMLDEIGKLYIERTTGTKPPSPEELRREVYSQLGY